MTDKQIIIKRPIITEKSFSDANRGIFTSEVDVQANKSEIKNEIQRLFTVHVVGITTGILKGKNRRVGKNRKIIQKANIKKARVRLKSGEKIPLFEVGQSK